MSSAAATLRHHLGLSQCTANSVNKVSVACCVKVLGLCALMAGDRYNAQTNSEVDTETFA